MSAGNAPVQRTDEAVAVVVRYEAKDYEFSVDPDTETILDLRKRIAEETGVAVSQQELSFTKRDAMQVDDDKTLADYRFNGGCFMDLVKK